MYENKLPHLLGAWALMSLLCGCSDPGETDSGLEPETRSNVSLRLPAASDAASSPVWDHMKIYLFNTDDTFKSQVTNVRRTGNNLKMEVPEGSWDLVLAGADRPIDLIAPVFDTRWENMKMWETKPSGGELPSMPELRTGNAIQVNVDPDRTTTISDPVQYTRNVAKVQVIITEAAGLSTAAGANHRIELTNVPTTLAWSGSLYPDRTRPTVSDVPLKGKFVISDNPSKPGYQKSDTVSFIIPAHRTAASAADTTTCLLKMKVDLPYSSGGTSFTKSDVVIPRAPRNNEILQVRLRVKGSLEVESSILPWKDVNISADISTTKLYTSKPRVELAYKDTVFVQTNASTWTVAKDPAASWLTVTQTADKKAVVVTADINSYPNSPRNSFFTITANNVVKKVPVRQRPDEGTIRVDKKRIVLAPPSGYTSTTLNITSTGGDWMIVGTPQKATANKTTGSKGTTNVTITRKSTTTAEQFPNVYGDENIIVKNKQTLDTDTIKVVNCYIDVPGNEIDAMMPGASEQSKETITDAVAVYGGNRNLNLQSHDNWIHHLSWDPNTQKLRLTTDKAPDEEARDGYVTLTHKECTAYSVKVKVHQDIIVTIPAFDFFVLKFIWPSGDVDIAAEFAGNGTAYDKKPVGWNLADYREYKDRKLLEWGGDARAGQGETAFFNAPVLEGDQDSPRKIKMEIYATWFSSPTAERTMTFQTMAYKGGEMRHEGTNFNNYGGTKLYQDERTVRIPTTQGVNNYADGGYTHVATLEYDRIKHSAKVTFRAQQVSLSRSAMPTLSPEKIALLEKEAAKTPKSPFTVIRVD